MIDGINFAFTCDNIDHIIVKLGLRNDVTRDIHGEVVYPIEHGKYNRLSVTQGKYKELRLKGSLHMYYKGENATDFTYTDVGKAIDLLCNEFEVNEAQAYIHRIECGVNVLPTSNAYALCSRAIAYKNAPFETLNNIGYQAKAQRYRVKIYSKSKQCQLPENILRFEMAITKMKHIAGYGIETLADLRDKSKWLLLEQNLIELFTDIIFAEDANERCFTIDDLNIYRDCTEPRKLAGLTPNKRCRRKKQYEALLLKHGTSHHKADLTALIAAKLEYLHSN